MVHNPKNSQEILKWCIESALQFIFDKVNKSNEKRNRYQMHEDLYSHFGGKVNHRQVSSMFYELKRHGYVELSEGDSVKLTNKAKIKIIDKISGPERHDGKLRLVSFDIPEIKKVNRNNFRRAIKKMGFKQVQKSLWISNRNVGELVDAAAKEYKVSDYVAYFVAERSNIDRHIKDVLSGKIASSED